VLCPNHEQAGSHPPSTKTSFNNRRKGWFTKTGEALKIPAMSVIAIYQQLTAYV